MPRWFVRYWNCSADQSGGDVFRAPGAYFSDFVVFSLFLSFFALFIVGSG